MAQKKRPLASPLAGSPRKKAQRIHAFSRDILGKLDATAIAEKIRRKQLSPEEVVKAAIKRAEKVALYIEAIEIYAFADAHEKAKKKDFADGIFAGVPTFIKDNSDLEGFPTRNGSRAYSPKIAREHGKYVEQFLKQGFIVLGKTRMPEFGFNASTEFEGENPVRNPWNLAYSAGGSSGGSAALVASGVVPIAHANDGGGSIRIPAACCGLVGLKPTRDRHINSKVAESMPLNIVSEGVLTRTVRDTANFHFGMEQVYRNPRLKPIGKWEGPSKRKYRIGLVLDSPTGVKTEEDIRQLLLVTAGKLERLGHVVLEVDMRNTGLEHFVSDFTLYWSLLGFFMGSFGKWILGTDFDPRRLDPFTKGLVDYYKKNFWQTPAAMYRLWRSRELYERLIAPYHAIMTPVLAHTVPPLGHLSPEQGYDSLMEKLQRYVLFTPLNNAAGTPAISLPLGLDRNGNPIGVQLMAAQGEEGILIDLAFQLEADMGFVKIYE
ncbi:MAG: amidase [Leptospiraceae bacterium]|nr:amidase [Leptospiraceae bacterium]MDW8305873.1 amidase [Leptospiraceae bacterium]